MRRAILLLTVMGAALALASGVALAQVINCPTGANGLCVGTDNNDTFNGTVSADDMRGLEGRDTLNAGAEFDLLAGGRGNDILKGEADNDTLSGDLGDDLLDGGPGNDAFLFANGWGRDRIAGDVGMVVAGERLSFSLLTQGITMDLIPSASRPEVRSGSSTLDFGPNVVISEIDGSSTGDDISGTNVGDFLNGIQGSDAIRGRAGGDDVLGMNGNDELFGGPGGDQIEAGNGNDLIHADDGAGGDNISCGPGNDRVFFDQGQDALINPNACEARRPQ